MADKVLKNYHSDAVKTFRNYKKIAEGAIEQVADDEFFAQIDGEANSIAIIVKHIAGNSHSRWRDFLTSDGEKADRNRDTEFELGQETRAGLIEFWESGWQTLFDALEPLVAKDLGKTISIRGQAHTVLEAINRQMTHYAYHVGQIVLLAKHFRSSEWRTLSVPKNRSAEFNKFLADKQAAGDTRTDRMDAPVEFARQSSEK
jgi:Protein of unknown function (DUF1572)